MGTLPESELRERPGLLLSDSQRQQRDATRHAAARQQETSQECLQRLDEDAARHVAARDQEEAPESRQRLEEDAVRHAAARMERQGEECAAFLAAGAERNRLLREELRRRAPDKLAMHYTRETFLPPPRLQFGHLDVICDHCGASR